MTDQVLARKFRPQSPEELVGQPALVTWLRRTLDQERVAPAYLFSGIRGVGKTSAARILAKGLNCLDPDPRKRPCNECSACRAITAGRHVDVLEIDAATYSKVEQVRELAESLRYGPAEGRYKVVILDEVHRLSRQAFDALLKLLEEPPPHLVFLFATTEIEAVPATILSRCQEFHLRRVPVLPLADHLATVAARAGIQASRKALEAIARSSEGSVRDAVSLLDQLATFGHGQVREEHLQQLGGGLDLHRGLEILGAIARGDARTVSRLCRELTRQGHEPREAHRTLLELAREALGLALDGADAGHELPAAEREPLARFASSLPYVDLLRLTQHLLSSEPVIRKCEYPELALELAWLRAAELPRLARIEELLRGNPFHSSPQPSLDLKPPQGEPLPDEPPEADAAARSSRNHRSPTNEEPPRTRSLAASGTSEPEDAKGEPTLFSSSGDPVPALASRPSVPASSENNLQRLIARVASRRQVFAAQLETAHLECVGDELRITPLPEDGLLRVSLSKPSNLELLEQAVREVFGRSLRISFQGHEVPASAELENPKKPQLEAARQDPRVREILGVFGGDVADVVPLLPRSRRKSE